MFENTFTYKTTLRVLEMLFHMVKFWFIIFTVRFGKSPRTALFRAVVKMHGGHVADHVIQFVIRQSLDMEVM